MVILGSIGGRLEDLQAALWGDEIVKLRTQSVMIERAPNGLFVVDDEVGGLSKLSAVVWLRLARHFNDIRVRGRLFVNPRAAIPLSSAGEELAERVFDRRRVLLKELERIRSLLVTRYRPEKIIVFGSVAEELASESADVVHEWSDIDLLVVKRTRARFLDRIREVLDVVQSRVGLNVLVYTPEELALESDANFFIRDEVLGRGRVLFP